MASNFKLPASSTSSRVSITFTKGQSAYLEKWYQTFRKDDQENLDDAVHRFMVTTATLHQAETAVATVEDELKAVWSDRQTELDTDFPAL